MSIRSVSDPRNLSPNRPYSPAVVAGEWVYTAGHVPFRQDGSVGGVTTSEQTEQVLRNLECTLEAAGAHREDIVATTVYLTDIRDIDGLDLAYREFFGGGPYPARTTVEISALGRSDFRVEISAIAKRPAGNEQPSVGGHGIDKTGVGPPGSTT